MADYENRELWPGWKTVRLIGRGSFGGVYEIERDVFGHTEKAALKFMTIPQNESDIDELVNDGYDEKSITARFNDYLQDIVREYTMMAEMKGCANIVYCDDLKYIQHSDGIGWDILIKMELLEPVTRSFGKDVSDNQVIKFATDICNALSYCEKRHVLHRDIKPQNIFVSQDGTYKLGDFGIAKTADHTTCGTKTGTYKYMAPEVYNNQPYGTKADIYSLGIVMYWLLNDRRTPFLPLPPQTPTATDEDEARRRRLSGEKIPAPSHGTDELKRIVLKACAFDTKDRYQSAEEMKNDLEALKKWREHVRTADFKESYSLLEDDDSATVTVYKKAENLKDIVVGIDLVHDEAGEIAYNNESTGKIDIYKFHLPWKKWKMDSSENEQLFKKCLNKIKTDFERLNIGKITEAVMVVPYSFSYLQKTKIVQIAKEIGINIRGMDTAGMFISMEKAHDEESNKNSLDDCCYRDIICSERENDFEFTVVEVESGIYLSLGTVGISCSQGWDYIPGTESKKKIQREINQFLTDIGYPLESGDKLPEYYTDGSNVRYPVVYRIYMDGKYNSYVEDLLYKMTGKHPENAQCHPAAGALAHGLLLNGIYEGFLRLPTFNKNLWIGVGDDEERKIAFERYTTIPAKRSVHLRVHAGSHIRIYEGNYCNPAFDCLLDDFSLNTDEKESECQIDIDSPGIITVVVLNNKGKEIMKKKIC